MTARDYPVFTVTPKAERSLKAGHPWVYGEEVTAVEGVYQNGDMVDVVSSKGRYLGSGWVNDHSKIRVRVISRNANDTFDEAFFRRRVRYALDYRKTVMGPTDYRCCRLIFGEADQFPGLTVDRFENVLVTQVLSLGMERRKDMVYRALVELLREDGETIDAIYERNDVAIRALEGLEQGKGFYPMEGLKTDLSGHVTITENGIKYDVDYIEGLSPAISIDQKTTSKNPRSTVGTVTEIYDYLRLLWARVGTPHCPKCGKEIEWDISAKVVWEEKNCNICGGWLVKRHPAGFWYASSDYIGMDTCYTCWLEECLATHCLGCKRGNYPDCKWIDLKKSYQEEDK